jgi:hypothetical protein
LNGIKALNVNTVSHFCKVADFFVLTERSPPLAFHLNKGGREDFVCGVLRHVANATAQDDRGGEGAQDDKELSVWKHSSLCHSDQRGGILRLKSHSDALSPHYPAVAFGKDPSADAKALKCLRYDEMTR